MTLFDDVDPFMSNIDIPAGDKWVDALQQALDSSVLGLLIVTSENLANPWIHFEAGFLEGARSKVIPVLVDIEADSIRGPLARLQGKNLTTETMQDATRQIYRTIMGSAANASLPERLQSRFEELWENAQRDLALYVALSAPPQQASVVTFRSRAEMYLAIAKLLEDATTRVFDTTWGRPPHQRSKSQSDPSAAGDPLAQARGRYLTARDATKQGIKYFSLIGESPRYMSRIEAARARAALTSDYEVVSVGGSFVDFPIPDFIVVDDRYVVISDYHRLGADDHPVLVDSSELARLLIGWFDECIRSYRKGSAASPQS